MNKLIPIRRFIVIASLVFILSLSLTLNVVMISDFNVYHKVQSTLRSFGLFRNPDLSNPNYDDFLMLISNDSRYNVHPVCEYNSSYNKDKINIILRHDLDYNNGFKMAEMELQYGIKSTYYLRLHSSHYDARDVLQFYKDLENMNYEIGYHYEIVDIFLFDNETAKKVFELELEYLRKHFKIRSVSSHGGKYNYQFEWWADLSQYNVISAYEIPFSKYLSDNSLEFKDRGLEYFSSELKISNPGDTIEILIHPSRWDYS